MKAALFKHWDAARASYWFVPSLMSLAAIGLAFVLTTLDGALEPERLDSVEWLYANKPEGARALLSTIAGSMITIAALTFSMTIAAVAYASAQFGPRLLTNFMQDRGNQITLGTFIATFLYCLLVLRTIRSPDETPVIGLEQPDLAAGFVPHIALLFGFILALASIGVLIFFIHHVPESIHASNVVAGIGRELNEKIDQLFPEMIEFEAPQEDAYDPRTDVPGDFLERAAAVHAKDTGYVQHIDEKGVLRLAQEHDLLLRVEYRPGDFVSTGKVLVHAFPKERVSEAVVTHLRRTFAMGSQRTQAQDVLFLVYELTEVASRALSPGTNDPFTAMTCLDWLGSAVINLSRRTLPGPHRYDEAGRLRVIAQPITFELFTATAFEPPRPYIEADRNAALHLMRVLAEVAACTEIAAYREVLLQHAQNLKAGCVQKIEHQTDLDAIEERYQTLLQLLRSPEGRQALADETPWLSGRG